MSRRGMRQRGRVCRGVDGTAPGRIAGLYAWFRSDTSLTGSTPITAWGDKSGNGFALGTASGPTRVAADLNGFDTLSFDGVDDYLDVSGFPAATFSGLTQFMVIRYEDQASFGMYTSIGDTDGVTVGDEIRNSSGTEQLQYATAAVPGPSSSGTYADQWVVVSATHVGPTGAVAMYVNGALVASAASSGLLASGKLAIGRRNTSGFNAKFKTPELIFYSRVLAGSELHAAESYLYARYGITP